MKPALLLTLFALTIVAAYDAAAQQNRPGSSVTSAGSGTGDLGGLAGADKICHSSPRRPAPATARGARTSAPAVQRRERADRIGAGPWYNVKGVLIAQNVADLHSDKANINNDTALDEQGRTINAQGAPNRHDILTGSTLEGRASDMTCNNWTSSTTGSAMPGITTASRSASRARRGTRRTRRRAARPTTCAAPAAPAFLLLRGGLICGHVVLSR